MILMVFAMMPVMACLRVVMRFFDYPWIMIFDTVRRWHTVVTRVRMICQQVGVLRLYYSACGEQYGEHCDNFFHDESLK
jgi:hypothetical protein